MAVVCLTQLREPGAVCLSGLERSLPLWEPGAVHFLGLEGSLPLWEPAAVRVSGLEGSLPLWEPGAVRLSGLQGSLKLPVLRCFPGLTARPLPLWPHPTPFHKHFQIHS